ncbi:MAG TPA: DUF1566 domain-containing protein, partial [Geobacteraceae bacterium]
RIGRAWPTPRFIDNSIADFADRTVTDSLTGLIWAKDGNLTGSTTWQQALDYVKTLNISNYQGHSDWRLPNINELESLVNREQADSAPWLNGQGFVNVQSGYYWSSTTDVATNGAWGIYSYGGFPDNSNVNQKGYSGYVWPVRSGQSGSPGSSILPKTGQTGCFDDTGTIISCAGTGQDGEIRAGVTWPVPRFMDNSTVSPADRTVTDELTGLVWAKDGIFPGAYAWQEVLAYIKTLNDSNYLGHNDWRLPNVNELKSLFNKQEPNQATWLMGQGFAGLQSGGNSWYWSSSTKADRTDSVTDVNMVRGVAGFYPKSQTNDFILLVRSGQSGGTGPDVTPPVTMASPAGGTYASPINVTLTSSEPATIYYTVDGSIPTMASPVYSGAIPIASSMTLKFFSRDAAGNSETVVTAQYVIKANQTINFPPLADRTIVDAPFALGASADSGLAITYISTNPAVATVSGNMVTIVGTGTTTIIASQGGDGSYNAAPTVARTLTVTPVQQDEIELNDNGIRSYFTTLSAAYNGITSGSNASIRLPAMTFTEALVFDKNCQLTIKGGYDPILGTYSGVTSIQGNVTIQGGSVSIDGSVCII